ncbi:hypothetical protein I4641_13195 [Waterburya agarophytonicola K14]|uniref:Uncharacterized protein n=1 Tax=Waterburya agarophytonicola KI4 TaxID=2874699 RepID=A0A964BU66_9CYAN|nr:hypothetical protein [Waterburya agarophytonicola]MCC0177935.1 hypothetical protein [Waterburya agarophytonicola KI4]
MTTIVRHRKTGNQYILLSINGEENKTNPSRFINELFNSNQQKSEVSCSATVCDVEGNLFLAYIDDLIVIEIDGEKPADILPKPEYKSTSNDFHRQQARDLDDEEFEEEEFEEEESDRERVIITPKPESSAYSQSESDESDFDEEDEEWI